MATALRLPSHLGDPRLAWPAYARDALPGPFGFYAVLVALLAALVRCRGGGAAPVDGGRREGRPLLGPSHQPASARWASGRDLRALRVDGPTAAG